MFRKRKNIPKIILELREWQADLSRRRIGFIQSCNFQISMYGEYDKQQMDVAVYKARKQAEIIDKLIVKYS